LKRANNGRFIKSSSVGVEPFSAFVPHDLPPKPPIDLASLQPLLEKANMSLGRLDGMGRVLPDISIFLYMYVRKEAVLSSQIEGTMSSLSDLLIYESKGTPGVPMDDVQEVSSYVAAMDFAMGKIEELPISLRFIKETHRVLMSNSRGSTKSPGEFRKSQNWIGGTHPGNAKFVPPPVEHLNSCLGAFEKFIHAENNLPTLLKAAMAHVQFETIHPFLDGNGRMGRMLIILMLYSEGLLAKPYLYLSYYFKKHRSQYYEHLQAIRVDGDWESWCEFFLKAIIETSNQASETISLILAQFKKDENLIAETHKQKAGLGALYQCFQKTPITTSASLISKSSQSKTTVLRGLKLMAELNIIKDVSGKERNKIYVYQDYLKILNSGINL